MKIHRNIQPGERIHRDTTIDSDYMTHNMPLIGQAIRNAYYWVPKSHTIHLVMDNAGGHGTNEVKQDYTNMLKKTFNIEIVWQVPNSPEFNLLDLGAWMAIQSEVEKVHLKRTMQPDVLADSIYTAFQNISPVSLENIHYRWCKVLSLVLQNAGGNDLVHCDRGRTTITRFTIERENIQEAVNIGISDDEPSNESDEDSTQEEGYEDDDYVLVEDD